MKPVNPGCFTGNRKRFWNIYSNEFWGGTADQHQNTVNRSAKIWHHNIGNDVTIKQIDVIIITYWCHHQANWHHHNYWRHRTEKLTSIRRPVPWTKYGRPECEVKKKIQTDTIQNPLIQPNVKSSTGTTLILLRHHLTVIVFHGKCCVILCKQVKLYRDRRSSCLTSFIIFWDNSMYELSAQVSRCPGSSDRVNVSLTSSLSHLVWWREHIVF